VGVAEGGASEEDTADAMVARLESTEVDWRVVVGTGTSGLVEGGALRVGRTRGVVLGEPRVEAVGTEVVAVGTEVVSVAAGTEVGKEVGTEVGKEVGKEVGTEVGVSVGIEVGVSVGIEVGTEVAASVRTEVGVSVGSEIGVAVGSEVGVAVGTEGAAVGTEVAVSVRTEVGVSVGSEVGAAEGTKVEEEKNPVFVFKNDEGWAKGAREEEPGASVLVMTAGVVGESVPAAANPAAINEVTEAVIELALPEGFAPLTEIESNRFLPVPVPLLDI